MTVQSAQSVTVLFTTRVFSTGVGTNADSLPTGTLYVNGTADAASVTVTNISTGLYKAAVTLPTLAAGDEVQLSIAATVSTIADKAVIWGDTKDIICSSGAITTVTTTTNLTTNNDKTGYGLSSAAVQAIWDALTSALTTANSIGKLLVDNVNATISSRLATSGYTAPDNTSITAIKAKTDLIPATPASTGDAMTLTTGERNSVADALLNRDMSTGTDSGSPTVRTVRQALRFLRNKWSIAGGALTVTKEDDATASWTATVSTDASAVPVTGSDPA